MWCSDVMHETQEAVTLSGWGKRTALCLKGPGLTWPTWSACQGIIQKLRAIHSPHTSAYSIMISR